MIVALSYHQQVSDDYRRLKATNGGRKPWGVIRGSRKRIKQSVHRIERRRARLNPECAVQYSMFVGWG